MNLRGCSNIGNPQSRGILFGLFKDRDDLQREIRINIQKPILEYLGRRDGSSSDHGEDNSSQAPPSAVATDDMAGQRSDEEELGILYYQEMKALAPRYPHSVPSREWQPC